MNTYTNTIKKNITFFFLETELLYTVYQTIENLEFSATLFYNNV